MPFSLSETRRELSRTPDRLDALLRTLPDAALGAREGPGTWSPDEVLSHVLWGEVDDWLPRVRRVLSGSGEPFTPFDREEGAGRYAGWSVERRLDEFRRLRTANLAELDALAIGPDHLRLEGRHPEFGRVTLEELLATWITHDFAHLTQIARVVTRHYGRSVGPWRAYFSLLREDSRSGS